MTEIPCLIHGLKDFPHIWLQMSFLEWFQTCCKISFFPCPFLSQIWLRQYQNGSIMVKMFQLLHSRRKKSQKSLINMVFRHSCLDIRVAISHKALGRISWYVPHFEGFCIPVKMQPMICLETNFTPSRLLCLSLKPFSNYLFMKSSFFHTSLLSTYLSPENRAINWFIFSCIICCISPL